jgi:hypothetical protein
MSVEKPRSSLWLTCNRSIIDAPTPQVPPKLSPFQGFGSFLILLLCNCPGFLNMDLVTLSLSNCSVLGFDNFEGWDRFMPLVPSVSCSRDSVYECRREGDKARRKRWNVLSLPVHGYQFLVASRAGTTVSHIYEGPCGTAVTHRQSPWRRKSCFLSQRWC